jgi:hypothetical protein
MKRKISIATILLVLSIGGAGCSKECVPSIAACSETPPTNEVCDAYFERWFFNKDKNRCEKIGYSGCSQKGFATQQECEECTCD